MRQRAAAHRGHRRRAVRLEDVADDADRVRELFLRRQHRRERAAGKVAVADLAAGRAAHEFHFTDRERREVVVEHEALEGLAFEVFDLLRFLRRAEGHGDERLRLAAGEDGRAVRAREHVQVDRDRTDLGERAAVDALVFLEHEVAEDLHFHLAPGGVRGGEALGVFRRNGAEDLASSAL